MYRKTGKTTVMVALTSGTAIALAACGGSDGATSTSATSAASQQRQFPGANGLIASISGTTLQVQSQDAQKAVTYKDSTQITQTKTVALSAVKVGDCVTANGEDSSGVLAAASVRITAPVNGSCTNAGAPGGAGGAGMPPGGMPSGGMPEGGMPDGGTPPSGMPGGGPGGGAGFTIASGKVTSISANGIVLSGRLITIGPSSSPNAEADQQVKVTTNSSTKMSKEVPANSSALVVGQCARAVGEADDKGNIAARVIAVSAPVDGKCQSGFGGPQ